LAGGRGTSGRWWYCESGETGGGGCAATKAEVGVTRAAEEGGKGEVGGKGGEGETEEGRRGERRVSKNKDGKTKQIGGGVLREKEIAYNDDRRQDVLGNKKPGGCALDLPWCRLPNHFPEYFNLHIPLSTHVAHPFRFSEASAPLADVSGPPEPKP